MSQKLLALIFLLLLSVFAPAQETNASDKSAKAAEEAAVLLEKRAVELLRETSAEVNGLRTIENRISFNAELASLMWFHDEKVAAAMYGNVIGDFKQLLAQLDMQLNSPVLDDDDDIPGGMFGRYGTSNAQRKMRIALMVRQQIAMSLAEHAPDLAFSFYLDSGSLISNPQIKKEMELSSKYFEAQLIQQIGEADALKAVEFGNRSIKNGIESHHISLLKKIYEKDEEKGIEFGAEILSRLRSDRSAVKELSIYSSLLNMEPLGVKAKNRQKTLFTKSELRDIADQFARALLENTGEPEEVYMAGTYAEQIDLHLPGRGAQVRSKYKSPYTSYNSVDMVANAKTSADAGMANAAAPDRAQAEREEKEKAAAKLMEDIKEFGSKPLSPEDRQKVVTQARGIIARTPGKEKKIMALNLLAVQVMRAGDKELAAEIMIDAERFLPPQPKNYRDFLLTLMVASGYAETDPGKAFPLLQDTISRVNETIAAAVKVAEFMDATNEMVVDGEVQVGSFGGSMVRELTKELGMASATIRSLAKADFERTRNLTNSFDRTEVRLLAKMMVLRAVMPKSDKGDLSDVIQDPRHGDVLN